MNKKEPMLHPENEEEEKTPEKPAWKKPEPPPRFKYDDSGFPIADKKKPKSEP